MQHADQNNTTNQGLSQDKIVGIDLGGTRIRAVLANGSGDLLARVEFPTEARRGKEFVIENLVKAFKEVTADTPPSELLGLGIGAPGPLNPESGTVYSPPNLPGWTNVPLVSILEAKLGVPVYLGNDANLGALGEYTFGAGKNYRYLVYITVSTGIGGGVINDGRMITGANGAAAEIGHMTIEAFGPLCNCGNYGCLEVMASGTGIRRRAIELLETGRESILSGMTGGNLSLLTAEMVEIAARQGDQASVELLNQTGFYLGVGVTNSLHLFNPEVVVLGGGVMRIGDLLLDPIIAEVKRRAMSSYVENLSIVITKLGEDVGLYGAVALVLQNYELALQHKKDLLKSRL